tara:strand:+ start:3552 stop:4919 length:1368 start_codon:yes stop_codon:yes gene_type:complete
VFIVGGNQSAGGYNIDNGLRFNDGSSDNLSRANGTATNRKKYTFNGWVKRAHLGTRQRVYGVINPSSTAAYAFAEFQSSSDTLHIDDFDGSSTRITRTLKRVFRDVSAWYNIHIQFDSTLSTGSDRMKVYINGVQETEFSHTNNGSQNYDGCFFDPSKTFHIGRAGHTSFYFDGYQCQTIAIDGQALDPDNFGEFDEDSGIWKPIDPSSLSFGNNGFWMAYGNSSNLGEDSSGNGNDFTVNNLTSIDQVTDTPTNNYSTYNPLYTVGSVDPTFSNGNCTSASPTTGGTAPVSTFAIPKSGKWFWEVKIDSASSISDHVRIGINVPLQSNPSNPTYGVRYLSNGNKNVDSSAGAYGASYTQGDIIGVAVDSDGNTVEFYKNGSSQGSISYTQQPDDYFAVTCEASNTLGFTFSINFGNPPYTISSGNSDGNGYGNFEYSVPSGYHALNTKNLAEYG